MNPSSYISPLEIEKAINHAELFAGIGTHEQHALANKLTVMQRQAGEVIIEQGEVGDRLYMIISGYVEVFVKHGSDGWARINRLGPSDVFGEIAILRRVRRTARIVAETPCTFLTINAHDFLEIYQTFPPRARDNIQLIMAKRLAHHSHNID